MPLSIQTTVSQWSTAITHTLSLTTPYPGTEVERVQLDRASLPWKMTVRDYNPPIYDNSEIPHLDPGASSDIRFNKVDEEGVDRISIVGRYSIAEGFPRNPKGRTGLGGRGNLPRWGPNKLAVTIFTRYKMEQLPGMAEEADLSASVFNKQGLPVLEVLLVKMVGSEQPIFPQGFVAPKEVARQTHQRVLLDLCFHSSNMGTVARNELVLTTEPLFKCYKEISKSYMDDPMNTDNSWIEVVAASIHDSQGSIHPQLKCGNGVQSADWVTLDEKPDLHQNMAALMKKVVTLLKAYNPYNTTGEALLEAQEEVEEPHT